MDYGRPVQFGVFLTPAAADPRRTLELAVLADELGFELVGVQDHPYQHRFLDTWTLLTAIGMRTSRITVFPDVLNVPLRPPAVLAKAAASLDLFTGGRLELGLGAGGSSDAIGTIGGPIRTRGESVSALAEAIEVIRLMWSGDPGVRFDGRFYQLDGVHAGPAPAHPIGIWLGAYRPRMLSLVGRAADGWVPSLGYVQPADLLEGNRRIDEAAAEAGRDPRLIRRVLNAGADVSVEQFTSLTVETGMDSYVIGGIEDPDALRWFASEVAPAVREIVAASR
ncbi:MAG TPA: LLM class flavin-dependent oxidoreductase [Candidatus Baltobacterales bacterium]|nr:LLM class flavin-dependent oxidoreductase [Candidatus Baltobacterales bacterium]